MFHRAESSVIRATKVAHYLGQVRAQDAEI
jgi:hypothetical protein